MKRGTIEHLKTRRLARLLNVRLLEAAGLLEALWHLTGKNAPAGDIGRFDDAEIVAGCHWEGKLPAAGVIGALVDAGWVERDPAHRLLVHDWHHHADDATRVALQRAGKTFANGANPRQTRYEATPRGSVVTASPASVVTVSRQSNDKTITSLPYPCPIPALPIPKEEQEQDTSATPPVAAAAAGVRDGDAPGKRSEYTAEFEAFWQAYPRKEDKRGAAKAFARAKKRANVAAIMAGLATSPRLQREPQYIPHGASWLNGDGWADVAPVVAVDPALIVTDTLHRQPDPVPDYAEGPAATPEQFREGFAKLRANLSQRLDPARPRDTEDEENWLRDAAEVGR